MIVWDSAKYLLSKSDIDSLEFTEKGEEHFSCSRFPIEGSIFADIVSMERSKKLGRENTREGQKASPKRQCRALNPGLLMLHPCYWVAFQRQCSIEHGAPISQDLLPSVTCRPLNFRDFLRPTYPFQSRNQIIFESNIYSPTFAISNYCLHESIRFELW